MELGPVLIMGGIALAGFGGGAFTVIRWMTGRKKKSEE